MIAAADPESIQEQAGTATLCLRRRFISDQDRSLLEAAISLGLDTSTPYK
jgi:hypothetical protein